MSDLIHTGDARISGNLTVGGDLKPLRAREAVLSQEAAVAYPIDLTHFRVWDALATVLPGTSATDDLGISGGTWGTHAPKLTTGDVKASTVTRYGRVQFRLPPEYEAGETVTLRISAGMETTVADTSATVDAEVYVNGRDGTIDGADLCATAAASINSLTFADKSFTITATALEPGDALDIRIAVAVVDGATATAVIATIGAAEMLLDIRG